MEQIVMKNNQGFTLIEAMIAILVMTFIMLGTMTWMISIYRTSTDNMVREEAVKLTQEVMERMRNRRFDSLTAGTNSTLTTRYVQKRPIDFEVTRTLTNQVANIAFSLRVNVMWDRNLDVDRTDTSVIDGNYDGNYTAITILGNKDES